MPEMVVESVDRVTNEAEVSTGVDTGRILQLDGLRALAIGLVITCHYPMFGRITTLFHWGWIGVDIFFVLSGFLITNILLELKERNRPFLRFYARRTARIFPPYFIVVGVILLLAQVVAGSLPKGYAANQLLFVSGLQHTSATLNRAAVSLSHGSAPSLLSHEKLRPTSEGLVPNDLGGTLSPTWSLSVEEVFYLLWAPVIVLLKRRSAVWIAATSIVGSLFYRWLGFTAENFAWHMDFVFRAGALATGSLLALCGNRAGAWLFTAPCSLILLLCAVVPGLPFREERYSVLFTVIGYPLIALASAGLVSMLADEGRWLALKTVFRMRPLVYIGQRSYTLYLVHVPIYFLVYRLVGGSVLFVGCVSLATSLLVAEASWRWMERPISCYRPNNALRLAATTLCDGTNRN